MTAGNEETGIIPTGRPIYTVTSNRLLEAMGESLR